MTAVIIAVGIVVGCYAHAWRTDPYVRARKLYRHRQRRARA